jgi:hypothetical protein
MGENSIARPYMRDHSAKEPLRRIVRICVALCLPWSILGSCAHTETDTRCYTALAGEVIKNPQSDDGSFFGIGGIRTGPDGSIYVLEAGSSSLIAFDREGHERWRAGRQGAGPREFGNPASLTIVSDLLIVWDFGNGRLSIWTTNGSQVRVVPMNRFRLPSSPGWVGAVDSTSVLAVVMPSFRLAPGGGQPALPGHVFLAGQDATELDTLLSFTFPPTQEVNVRGRMTQVRPPYAAYPGFSVLPEGLVAVSNTAEYEVQIFDRSGSLQRTIASSSPPAPMSDEHRAAYRTRLDDSAVASVVVFPKQLPAISQIYGLSDGAVLVETYWWRDGNARWDRWGRNGDFEYSLMLPRDLAHVSGAGGTLYGRVVDSLGVEYIQAFRRGDVTDCPGRVP